MTENAKVAKKPFKGGRKGGTTFPRVNLQQALEYASKLVSKTHTGPQPATNILPGVFGNSGPMGGVRASALKQYGLLEGSPKAYQASELAKVIESAPSDEKTPLIRSAFLNSKPFKLIYETFCGDTVSKAKIRQRALTLEVHPDSVEECVDFFLASAVTAGVGTRDGDSITLAQPQATPAGGPAASYDFVESLAGDPDSAAAAAGAHVEIAAQSSGVPLEQKPTAHDQKAEVTVSLNVDSSSDPEKLEKQLKLLRDYGVI